MKILNIELNSLTTPIVPPFKVMSTNEEANEIPTDNLKTTTINTV